MDNVDAATRSRTMAAIRSAGTRSTETRLRAFLVAQRFRGWRCQALELPGKPDFVFDKERVAIFVDGCFWHGCPQCFRMPKTNETYWRRKISRNIERDRQVSEELAALGWQVVRIWEHEIQQEPLRVIQHIRKDLESAKQAFQTSNPNRSNLPETPLKS